MNVTMPDGTVITDVPEGTTQSQLTARYAKLSTATTAAQSAQSKTGIEHAADAAGVFASHPFTAGIGMAENAVSSVTGGVGSLVEALTGNDPGSLDLAYRPRTQAGQEIARLGSEEAGKLGQQYDKVAGTGPLAQTLKERIPQAAGAVGTVTALAGIRGVAGRLPEDGSYRPPSRIPSAAGEAQTGAQAPAAARSSRLAPVSQESPSKGDLKAASRASYKQAEQSGTVITDESFSAAKKSAFENLQKEGLDPTLHPDTTAALKRFTDEQGPVTLEKLETLRKIAKDAETSQRPADQRLAGELVDHIDQFAENLGPKDLSSGDARAIQSVQQARNYWMRARKADTLDELVRRAELSASNFSGSGMENALRSEFRSLAKNERRMRLFTPEEQAAIERVAKGGPVENTMRMLGKFAPTGVVSAILSGGMGAAAGGPFGALALPAAGTAGRIAATHMTMKNVARANALVRKGPPIRNALADMTERNKANSLAP